MDRPGAEGELTHSQVQIWVGQRLHPESPLYNMAFAWVFPAELRADLFQEAWRRVADGSDALRTRVVQRPLGGRGGHLQRDGEARRRILEPGACVTEVLDLEPVSDPQAFRRWCRERCARPLAAGGELVDSVLVRLGGGKTGWYLNQHHLITDAWSTVLLYRQVAAEYAALLDGEVARPTELPTRPVQGSSMVPSQPQSSSTERRPRLVEGESLREPSSVQMASVEHRAQMHSAGAARGATRGATRSAVRDRPLLPRLVDYYPTAAALQSSPSGNRALAEEHWASRRSRPGRSVPFYGRSAEPKATASTRLTLELDQDRSRALDRLCRQDAFRSLSEDLSRFALFATLLVAWLHRTSGRDELGFDAPVAGRPTADAKRALGLFIEMFPFAAAVEPDDTFRSLGARCLEEAKRFLRHALPGLSSPSGAEASNVVLNYFPLAFGDFAGLPAEVEWVHPGHGDSVHALRLQVHDFAGSGRTTLHFDWNDGVLPNRLRRRSLRHFETLLAALLDDPDARIAAVDVVTGDERRALAELNAAAAPSAAAPLPERTVVALFRQQAEADPERVAVRQGGSAVSFGDLHRRSEALAATLVGKGVAPGDRVAISCRRSIEAVVAILAVLRARAAYVPVDPAYPRQRREGILRDSGARLLLAGEEPARAAGIEALSIAEGVRAGRGAILDRRQPGLDDLAYVLYTSGSTGRPKGVLIEHGGLADYLGWASRTYVRGDRLRFPLFTSLAFDLTVTSLFLPLLTGGELLIYPEPEGPVDSALADVVADDAVDFIKLTPSHLSLLRQMARVPSRLRRMVVGGEDFKTSLAAEVSARFGDRLEIWNEYGPTEAVVGCVAHRYDPAADTGPRVPIGAPADHVAVEILNLAMSPVPEGVPGELWVSRFGLARGYLGQDALTAERFPADSRVAHPRRPGERRYRTGDRVRLVDPGTLEYLGRLDRQLKISGFRVEPAEIEAALLALPAIEQCAVVPRRRAAPAAESGERRHCTRCGLASTYPRTVFDRHGVCSVCRSYESIREHAQGYFKTMDDLRRIFADSARAHAAVPAGGRPRYDCLMLFSGGKDSTYALCRLVEMGLSVYAFTLDNGFISEGAKDNIRRVARELGVTVELATTPAMNAIFRDSLTRFSNVCQGCFKTIYTLSTIRARELGIPIIVTGLSRGQMFETRLTEEMFRDGRRRPDEVDAAVLAARKAYHRLDDEVSRSLDVRIFADDRVFEEIRYVDFYRYCDVGLDEVLSYLRRKVPWVRPEDTGRSTNCLINDLGIYVHQQERGFHNYALPYSWDVRMGHKTRDQALDELDDQIDVGYVQRTLAEIGCDPERYTAGGGRPYLVAFYVAGGDVAEAEIRRHLAERLPPALVPAHLERLPAIPLTAHGKVDVEALPRIELGRHEARYRAPEGPVEEYLAGVWQEQLGGGRVGADDSFFELGGTSLGAMEVMIRLCREFDLDLPLGTLFAHPTLGALARLAEDRILDDVSELDDAERQRLLAGAEP